MIKIPSYKKHTKLEKNLIQALLKDDIETIKKCIDNGIKLDIELSDPTIEFTSYNNSIVPSGSVNSLPTHFKIWEKHSDKYAQEHCSHPIHILISSGSLKNIEKFIDFGADINACNSDGVTPLLIALYENRLDVLELLLKKGARPNQTFHDGSTILHIAASRGDKKAIQLLLTYKIDVDFADNDGETSLIAAITYDQLDCVELLVNNEIKKSNVNKAKHNGVSPLFLAAQSTSLDNVEMVNVLLKAKADPNKIRTTDKYSPLHLATALCVEHPRFFTIVKLLVNAGANLLAKENRGHTAMDIAKLQGTLNIYNYLKECGLKKSNSFLFFEKSFSDYNQKAQICYKEKNYKQAIIYFNEAIKLSGLKDKPSLYCNVGHCHFLLQQYKEAMTHYSKTIELETNYISAYEWRAKTGKKMIQDASDLLEKSKFIEQISDDEKKFLELKVKNKVI